MKKMTALLIAAGLVLISFSIANGHSFWAKYLKNPVPEDVVVPSGLIIVVDGENYLNCCACHGEDAAEGPSFKGFCLDYYMPEE